MIEGAHIEDLPKAILLIIFNKVARVCDLNAVAKSNRSFWHLSKDILSSRRRSFCRGKLPLYLEKPAFKQLVTKGFLVDSQKCRWEAEKGAVFNFIKSFKADEFYLIKKDVEYQDTIQYHFVLNDCSMVHSSVVVEFGFIAVNPGKSYSLKFKRKVN
ncbi:MAG: hypothetical protein JSR85_05975 [Proteobacteria bacterium]|nr:hypothetical protein [Pseudomonadota bacterium]